MHSPARTLMVQGTASGVGKSFLVAALCRIFTRRGVRVAPFKAQNMSNNAAVTADGEELGRAQAVQARAAQVDLDVRMNPVLLKPVADTRSDVVVLGRRDPEVTRLPWQERKEILWPVVQRALSDLRDEFELIVIEGAGSPAEINLRSGDLVNMAVARFAEAPVLLVADIDRGGAFASLYGTWALLPPEDRQLLHGFVLNRFRGDAALLDPGPALLEKRTGIPVMGVVPHVQHRLPEEDAATLDSTVAKTGEEGERSRIAAVRLPRLSNFDDLDPLDAEPGVSVEWIEHPDELGAPVAVVLPGTRNTLGDLEWLRASGMADAILDLAERGAAVIGLCGGYQMLGRAVSDPRGIEAGGTKEGLALLPVETTMAAEKITRRCRATITARAGPFAALRGSEVVGYEIHHGETIWSRSRSDCDLHLEAAEIWLAEDGRRLGVNRGRIFGSYLHGIFANDALRAAWLDYLGIRADVAAWNLRLDEELAGVADVVAEALNVDELLTIAGSRQT